MYKKAISIMSVMLIVFLCSYFPVHALEYISYTDYYSYDYGDVSINAQLSGIVSSRGSSYDYDPDIIQYNFSVTLTNKTNQFQVADINTFSFDFNTGVSGYFTVGTYKMGSGAFELVSSSDNTRDISWQIYPDYMRFYFKDAELLVLNPNETRSYTFSLIQEIPFNSNYNYINNSIVYSYMTSSSSSSITIYNRPGSWSSNSIEDLINNDSLPNSAIAWLIAQYEQGIITNQQLDDIINTITYDGTYPTITGSSSSNTYYQLNNNSVRVTVNRCIGKSTIIDNIFETNPDTDTYFNSYSINIPINYFIILQNSSDVDVQLKINNALYDAYLSIAGMPDSYIIDQLYGEPALFYNYNRAITIRNIYIPAKTSIVLQVYGHCNVISSNPNYSLSFTNTVTLNGSFIEYDPNNQENSIIDNVHSQEQSWFNQGNQAISNSGLENYQFSAEQSGGISGVSNDFVRVWNACGSLNSVWIFSLTLSLALYIIHHVPKQRS